MMNNSTAREVPTQTMLLFNALHLEVFTHRVTASMNYADFIAANPILEAIKNTPQAKGAELSCAIENAFQYFCKEVGPRAPVPFHRGNFIAGNMGWDFMDALDEESGGWWAVEPQYDEELRVSFDFIMPGTKGTELTDLCSYTVTGIFGDHEAGSITTVVKRQNPQSDMPEYITHNP